MTWIATLKDGREFEVTDHSNMVGSVSVAIEVPTGFTGVTNIEHHHVEVVAWRKKGEPSRVDMLAALDACAQALRDVPRDMRCKTPLEESVNEALSLVHKVTSK